MTEQTYCPMTGDRPGQQGKTERIRCPCCLEIEVATVDDYPCINYEGRAHYCKQCGYLITESERNKVRE